ncbi:DEAD-box ATP-dependent RNA helicase 40-like [Bidens hawaiensis]|uniref:DEAD-box ATP-dependent RNA helicase 40-like n=1 Tax=Bidens hawaiensis TaxID=980011 RepID=UPI00404B1275
MGAGLKKDLRVSRVGPGGSQQGGYNTPQSYQGVSMEQSQGYQFTPHYTGYQQWSHEYSRKQDIVIQKPPTRYGGPNLNTQQPSPFSQPQYGPKLQKQMPNVSSVGLKTGLKNSTPFNAKNGGIALVPHQPKFPTPMPKIHGKINSGNPTAVASPDALIQSSVDIHPKKHDVTAAGDKVPAPFMSFESTGFPPEILIHIQAAGFALPTPIQAQTWPIALQNRDLVALSKTDSGKTLAYLIPALMLLRRCNNNHEHGPTVVLSPTRELALQIQHEAIKFGRSVKISSVCLYSEGPKGPQLKDLERGADIVVATPGRLNEAIELRKLDFGQVSLLVLDETDKMLDMGFEPKIRKIVNEIPPRKQTLMYAATWRREVRNIAGDLLVNPVQVNIDNANELAANKCSTQDCKHASTDLTKVDGAANQPVPHNVREIATRGGGFRGRGGLRNDRFGGHGGPDSGRNRNDRLKDSCDRAIC